MKVKQKLNDSSKKSSKLSSPRNNKSFTFLEPQNAREQILNTRKLAHVASIKCNFLNNKVHDSKVHDENLRLLERLAEISAGKLVTIKK